MLKLMVYIVTTVIVFTMSWRKRVKDNLDGMDKYSRYQLLWNFLSISVIFVLISIRLASEQVGSRGDASDVLGMFPIRISDGTLISWIEFFRGFRHYLYKMPG
jgi:hypothetical protein